MKLCNNHKTRKVARIWIVLLPFLISAFNVTPAGDEITWYSFENAQELAKKNDKKILLFTEAAWCVYCKKMERDVFTNEKVIEAMNKFFYPVKINVDSDSPVEFNGVKMTEAQFVEKHNLIHTPTTVFMSREGEILTKQPGFIEADPFRKMLIYIGSGEYKQMSYEKYLQKTVDNIQ